MRNDLDIPFPESLPGQGAAIGEPYGRSSYATRPGGMDANTKRLAIIAGGIGGALLLLVGIWSAMAPRHAGIPVIEADARPLREKPLNKGGLTVIGADESGLGPDDGKTTVAPPPEVPALAALKATPSAPSQPSAPSAQATTGTTAASPSAPSPAQEVPPAALASRPTAPGVTSPAQRVALTPTAPAPTAPAPTAPAPTAPAPVTAPPAKLASMPAVRPAPTGSAQVQLAAVGSEAAAQNEWKRLAHKFPELLDGRSPAFTRTERDGRVFWRVRTSGFTDVASAASFCNQLRSKGGSCALASF
jgi:hypothetical protein